MKGAKEVKPKRLELKADEELLLTEEEIRDVVSKFCSPETEKSDIPIEPWETGIAKAQLEKDEARYQQRIKRIFREIEALPEWIDYGWTIEGDNWQAFKKKEVKE